MPTLANQTTLRGNIMAVDDNPANLKLLDDMLRQYGYEVSSFPRGRLALAAAEQEPPDLVLLDITMPEMNGFEVCEQFKSNAKLADVPIIFLSALDAVEDKVKGFRAGGVDYIPKPFQFEEVQVRVETHLALRRAQRAEHDLLERTLGGAVGTLWELVQLTSPKLAARSRVIQEIVQLITTHLAIENPWQFDLAATLCLLGCVALPEDVFERAYYGRATSPEEQRMFCGHPASAASLIARIPRLEVVAEMVRAQLAPPPLSGASDPAILGAHMLHLATEMDRRIHRGLPAPVALSDLKTAGKFDARMLKALESYGPPPSEAEVRRLEVRDLRVGMVLESDVFSSDGNLLIFKAGTVLTETWIQRLENFARSRGVREPVEVKIPMPDAAQKTALEVR